MIKEGLRALAVGLVLVGAGCLPSGERPPFYFISVLNQPCIRPYHAYQYKTCSELRLMINAYPLTIPPNFQTDLASIPRFYWPILSPMHSAFVSPAILHDYLYQCPERLTRYEIDNIFFYALRAQKVSTYNALKMYYAVRWFGGKYFHGGNDCNNLSVKLMTADLREEDRP